VTVSSADVGERVAERSGILGSLRELSWSKVSIRPTGLISSTNLLPSARLRVGDVLAEQETLVDGEALAEISLDIEVAGQALVRDPRHCDTASSDYTLTACQSWSCRKLESRRDELGLQ